MNDLDLTIHQVIEKYSLLNNKLRAKSYGQHFLCDNSLLKKIALCGEPFKDYDIIEIGAGPCGLTRAILDVSSENNYVWAIEKDENFKEAHNNIQSNYHHRLTFLYADAKKINISNVTQKDIIVIANLPYNVGVQILINLLFYKNIKKMVLMFQKEVADRICADVGTKEYGRLSVMIQLHCSVKKMFNVSKNAFSPAPKVDSTVILLQPKYSNMQFMAVDKLTNICFQHRRKTIYSILKKYCDVVRLEQVLLAIGIAPKDRPENISPEKFYKLYLLIENKY